MPAKHAFASAKSDGGDATLVRPSDWNGFHVESYAPGTFTLATGTFAIMGQFLSLTTTQVATLEGTAVLQIQGS